MIVVRSGIRIRFIQAELDDFFDMRRRKVKQYNLNNETEARLIYLLLHPLEWRRLKRTAVKKETYTKRIQQHLCKVFGIHKKAGHHGKKPRLQKAEKRSTVQMNIRAYTGEIPKKIAEKESPRRIINNTTNTDANQPAVVPSIDMRKKDEPSPLGSTEKGNQIPANQFVPESIISLFGRSGDLELLCPFCRDTLNFRFEDVDRRTFKNTRICVSCESINRASITIGNRFIFADFEKYHPEIAGRIRKLENEEKDEFGNPIYTYSFKNIS